MKKIFLFFFSILSFFFVASSTFAAQAEILSGFDKTKVCHNVDCDSPTPGILNFRPSGVDEEDRVTIDTETGILAGYIWGSEIGWTKLNPSGAGVVMDPDTGVLSGKAWSQVAGWVNFEPTSGGVTIDLDSGEFEGWAWAGGPYGGWIPFDCSQADRCVKTEFPEDDGGGGGCEGVCGTIDRCENIEGNQAFIPSGYELDGPRHCVPIVDICPNINGNQESIPDGYFADSIGNCFPNIDFCPNIAGVQAPVPPGYTVDNAGNCVEITSVDYCPDIDGVQTSPSQCPKVTQPADSCPNLDGIQSSVPSGYEMIDGNCFPIGYDMCRNLDGSQASVPEGMMLTEQGDCVTTPTDYCANLGGYQSVVPEGFYEDRGNCFFGSRPTGVGTIASGNVGGGMCEIIAFSFVHDRYRIPSNNVFLKTIVKAFDLPKLDCYSVDLVSTALVVIAITLFAFIVARIIRKILIKDKKDDDEDDYLPPRPYTPPVPPAYTPPAQSYTPPVQPPRYTPPQPTVPPSSSEQYPSQTQ